MTFKLFQTQTQAETFGSLLGDTWQIKAICSRDFLQKLSTSTPQCLQTGFDFWQLMTTPPDCKSAYKCSVFQPLERENHCQTGHMMLNMQQF